MYPPVAAPLGDVETERLELRRFRPDDLDGLAAVFAKPEVWQYPFGRGFTREETQAFLARQMSHWSMAGFGLWLTIERRTGSVIGFVGLSVPTFLPEVLPTVEVGWRLDPSVWGHGYATEGAAAALDEAFTTLGLSEVCSVPQAENPASVRVAERLGMRFSRSVAIPAHAGLEALSAKLFHITTDEWRARQRRAGRLTRS
jgi:RimJ/RimL family protein N-acetyltransferase